MFHYVYSVISVSYYLLSWYLFYINIMVKFVHIFSEWQERKSEELAKELPILNSNIYSMTYDR